MSNSLGGMDRVMSCDKRLSTQLKSLKQKTLERVDLAWLHIKCCCRGFFSGLPLVKGGTGLTQVPKA